LIGNSILAVYHLCTLPADEPIRFERRYYRYENANEREEKGFAYLDRKMAYSAGQVTPSLAELLALEGVSTPFEEAAKKVEKFLLFRVSDNTLREEAEAFGAIQDEIEQELIKQSQDENWLQKRQREQKTERKGRIYGSVDGFMVPLREGWKEFKALAWYNVKEITCWGVGPVLKDLENRNERKQ
jgi:hypothetical protein